MDIVDCHPILESIQNDFEQLHNYIVKAQSFISFWQLKSQATNLVFEIPPELLEPLDNLAKVIFSLLESTEAALNDKQLEALTSQLYATAFCYCFIREFIQLNCNSKEKHEENRNQAELEELTYQFYLYASSELETHITSLQIFSLMFKMRPSDYLVSPLVPMHENTLSQIDNWIDQLLKFSRTWTKKIRDFTFK
jgi:hypothetical protein